MGMCSFGLKAPYFGAREDRNPKNMDGLTAEIRRNAANNFVVSAYALDIALQYIVLDQARLHRARPGLFCSR